MRRSGADSEQKRKGVRFIRHSPGLYSSDKADSYLFNRYTVLPSSFSSFTILCFTI